MNKGLFIPSRIVLYAITASVGVFLFYQAQFGLKLWKQGFYFGKLQAYSHSVDMLNKIDRSGVMAHKYAVMLIGDKK